MPFCLLILISNCLTVHECIQVTVNSGNTESCRVEKGFFLFYPFTPRNLFDLSRSGGVSVIQNGSVLHWVEVKSFGSSGIPVRLIVVPLASPHQ